MDGSAGGDVAAGVTEEPHGAEQHRRPGLERHGHGRRTDLDLEGQAVVAVEPATHDTPLATLGVSAPVAVAVERRVVLVVDVEPGQVDRWCGADGRRGDRTGPGRWR